MLGFGFRGIEIRLLQKIHIVYLFFNVIRVCLSTKLQSFALTVWVPRKKRDMLVNENSLENFPVRTAYVLSASFFEFALGIERKMH